jgi:hypothetical protein
MVAEQFLPPDLLGGPNGQLEENNYFWSTNHHTEKIQTEIIKIPGTTELLTSFMGLFTEDTKTATYQFKIWMEKNNINIKTEWETYFPMFLRGPAYRWWISTEKAIDNHEELLGSFSSFFQEKGDPLYWSQQ